MTVHVVFLMGPTASGKTELAARLACSFDFELISVDAAQVYRGMNIGTAKPDGEFLENHPHHLIDIVDPDSAYSAAHFVADARALIEAIHARGRIPLLVGGTMFYFNALERGLSDLPSASSALRAEIEQEMQANGMIAMHELLNRVDPVAAARIDSNDRQRVQRALEIYRASGKTPSAMRDRRDGMTVPPIKLTLYHPDRRLLHQRIAMRFAQMVEQGLASEVSSLVARYPGFADSSAGRIVGYRQTLHYLDGMLAKEAWVEAGVAATRQLAKRQLTWLRQQSGLVWFDAESSQVLPAMKTYLDNRLT